MPRCWILQHMCAFSECICVHVCQHPDTSEGIKDALSPIEETEGSKHRHACNRSTILLQWYLCTSSLSSYLFHHFILISSFPPPGDEIMHLSLPFLSFHVHPSPSLCWVCSCLSFLISFLRFTALLSAYIILIAIHSHPLFIFLFFPQYQCYRSFSFTSDVT